jgi:hypothetical protein
MAGLTRQALHGIQRMDRISKNHASVLFTLEMKPKYARLLAERD